MRYYYNLRSCATNAEVLEYAKERHVTIHDLEEYLHLRKDHIYYYLQFHELSENEKKGFMRFIDRYLEDLYVKALEFYKECNDIKAVRALEAQGSLCYDARLQNV